MMRSMFSAISGLRVHQVMLDVTANSISNVNTVGYKSQRTSFKDALSQMQRGASGASTALGGTNPNQVGLGVQLGSIDSMMTAGAIQSTGNPFDLAIQGNGFFMLDGPQGQSYTRAGSFAFDKNGDLIVKQGKIVKVVNGATHVARPLYDRSIEKSLSKYFEDFHTMRMENFRLSDDEINDRGRGQVIIQPTGARTA